MERKQSKKAKSLRAVGMKSVNINPAEHRLVQSSAQVPSRNFAKSRIEVRRFSQNSAISNQAFTLADGHNQFLTVTNVSGACTPYVDSWRIKSVSLWAMSQDNGSTEVTLTPTGADLTSNMRNDKEQIFSCTSSSPSFPAHMRIKTSKSQPMGSWHFTSSTNFAGTLFQVNVVRIEGASLARVVIDIEFEVVDNLVGLPLGYTTTSATTTVGVIGGKSIFGGAAFLTGVNNLG